MSTPAPDPVEELNKLHLDIGRRAAEIALGVLEAADPGQIPFPAAVSLLKFGVDLERKALLGEKADGPEEDPFDALAKLAAGGQSTTPTTEPSKET